MLTADLSRTPISEVIAFLEQVANGVPSHAAGASGPHRAAPANTPLGVSQPLGGAVLDSTGFKVTVDTYANNPTVIPEVIRNLVANNEGYFAEEIFATPGWTVEGGAVIYTETYPDDHFLDPTQSIAPRAPGAEAARVGITRRPAKIAKPESWAWSLDVTDEARRRNDVRGVQRAFTRAGNTLADRMQSRAMETLAAFITASGRSITTTNKWATAATTGVENANPFGLPAADWGVVQNQFINDKAGVRFNSVIASVYDAYLLWVLYQDKLASFLSHFGVSTMRVSPHQPDNSMLFLKSKDVGYIAFETPLHTEKTREGTRFTDVFTSEAVPVFIADDATAIVELKGYR